MIQKSFRKVFLIQKVLQKTIYKVLFIWFVIYSKKKKMKMLRGKSKRTLDRSYTNNLTNSKELLQPIFIQSIFPNHLEKSDSNLKDYLEEVVNRGGSDWAALLSTNTFSSLYSACFCLVLRKNKKTKRRFLLVAGLLSVGQRTKTTSQFIMSWHIRPELRRKVSLFQVRDNEKTGHLFNFQIDH